MKYLLYCITAEGQPWAVGPELLGVDERPVFFIVENGLKAAVSEINHQISTLKHPMLMDGMAKNLAPNISQFRAYEKVVNVLHQHHGVIPLRYGSLFENETFVIQHLSENYEQYKELLSILVDCVEMGLRILPQQAIACPPTIQATSPLSSGYAYLEARRKHYAPDMLPIKEIKELFQQYCRLFEGLFVRCKMETPLDQIITGAYHIPLPSFYFLVPKRLVQAFCETFRNNAPSSEKAVKLLLNGPWPPYNFCTAAT